MSVDYQNFVAVAALGREKYDGGDSMSFGCFGMEILENALNDKSHHTSSLL